MFLSITSLLIFFNTEMERLTTLASQRAVVIFSNNSCCMSHTIKALFRELGVNPAIYELDEDPRGREIERALQSLGCTPAIPAVFIGGRLMTSSTNSSSTKEIMQLHLEGSLVPLLRSVGAIWL
ncbi:monothiol glutaredoxin-S7-like [Macadamia integrifolia]|uniref:monothiol glutaredoxin-S7-like n=1 Tax=Macadamia integrifolia TaxID=60698 RepID=UPI001C52D447|nr:monothiol glutaredoxin-S7-like [Macadamia integrifolia]